MKRTLITMLMLAGLLAGSATAFAADSTAAKEKQEAKDIVLKGDAKCTSCHDEEDSPEKLAIGKTKHGVQADKRTPTCTSCHGDSPTHIKKPEGVQDRPKVDVGYSKRATNTSVAKRNETCLNCHQGGKRIHWQSGVHANRDVACSSCHTIHGQHDKVRSKETQAEVCYTCHKEQRAQMQRPSHHPVPEGKMGCTSCHDIHSDNPKMLARASTNETCYTCHMEKRGPFVHNHQPVTEDCAICHNPHGTNNDNLLKSRAPFLCQQCHNDSSHKSQAGALPTARATSSSLLGTVGRGCLNCHTNIHGGNSTEAAATSSPGRLRR